MFIQPPQEPAAVITFQRGSELLPGHFQAQEPAVHGTSRHGFRIMEFRRRFSGGFHFPKGRPVDQVRGNFHFMPYFRKVPPEQAYPYKLLGRAGRRCILSGNVGPAALRSRDGISKIHTGDSPHPAHGPDIWKGKMQFISSPSGDPFPEPGICRKSPVTGTPLFTAHVRE